MEIVKLLKADGRLILVEARTLVLMIQDKTRRILIDKITRLLAGYENSDDLKDCTSTLCVSEDTSRLLRKHLSLSLRGLSDTIHALKSAGVPLGWSLRVIQRKSRTREGFCYVGLETFRIDTKLETVEIPSNLPDNIG